MKKLITLLLISMFVLNLHAQDKKKIALLQPRAVVSTTAVDPMEVSVVRGELRNALTNQSNFQVLTRLDVDKIFEEHEFQKSGLVDDTQRKRVGVMTGAQYICVSSITKFRNQIYIEAYMIDIETGEMTNTASQFAKIENFDYSTLPDVCQTLTRQMLGEIGSSNSRPQPNKSNYSSGSSSKPTVSTPANQNFTETVNGVSFTMVYVEGGTFTMGCTSEQGSDCFDDEKPAHSVTLSGYYIAETEVTQGLWQAVMGDNPSRFKNGNDYPVEQVSWQDAMAFCSRLSELTGRTYTLPTEAQWEYAARGGNKSRGYKYAGSDYLENVGWFMDNSGSTTHPVKRKSSNELGIYDMSGNVWEWCKDWNGSYSSNSQTNPTGPSSGSNRVKRGGSWNNNAQNCRVANRNNNTPTNRNNNIGFRVVLLRSL